MGITRVDAPEDLDAAIEAAREFDPKVLVETAAVNAREVEIGVLQGSDGSGPETSEIAEITVSSQHAFYDFEAKYLEESFQIPASLDEDVTTQVHELAVRAFEALDVEGLARVDFFVFRRRPAWSSTRWRPCPASPRPRCSRCSGRPRA